MKKRCIKHCLLLLPLLCLQGCTSTLCVYKVVFQGGEHDYYELDYKPKKGTESIVYDGEVITGVKTIEKVK